MPAGEKFQVPEAEVAKLRRSMGLSPVFKMVDTCAAEFPGDSVFLFYLCPENESIPTDRPKVLILGSGPNRIGQY